MQDYLTGKRGFGLSLTGALAVLVFCLVLALSDSSKGTASTKVVAASTVTTSSSAPEAPTATTSAASTPVASPSYPVVHFSVTAQEAGSWPFTAQLASITTKPEGTPGSPPVPPQFTYLLVQVNITSLVTDRPVQPPGVSVRCHAPGDSSWRLNTSQEGYDEGSEPPSATGSNVAMNDGQPHPWNVEWQVPATISTTSIKCVLLPETGSLKLN